MFKKPRLKAIKIIHAVPLVAYPETIPATMKAALQAAISNDNKGSSANDASYT